MTLLRKDSWHEKVYGTSQEKILREQCALLEEEGDLVRGYKAMHEKNPEQLVEGSLGR